MKRIRLRKNNVIAGQFIAMESEAIVPDAIAADLRARGQCDILGDACPAPAAGSEPEPAPEEEAAEDAEE